MSVLEKKQERSKAKTAVTLASRRLIGAAHPDVEYDVLKSLMTELEKAYDDFWVVNEEFELIVLQDENSEHGTVNRENVSEYRDNVKKCYEEAKELFLEQKTATQEISKSLTVEPVRIGLTLHVRRIGELLEVIESNINTSSPNMHALQLDQQDLQSSLDTLCGKTSELSLISSSQSSNDMLLHSEIEDIIGKAYGKLRSIKLYLQHCQNTNMTSQVSGDPQAVKTPSVTVINKECPTSSSGETIITPTSPSSTSVSNNQNAPAVIDSEPSTSISVSAAEIVPTTTPPETPATSEQPALTSTSMVMPQIGVNMGQVTGNLSQISNGIYQHLTTNALVNSPLPLSFSSPSDMTNLPPSMNPSITTSPQYPSSIPFYPSTNVDPVPLLVPLPFSILIPTLPHHILILQPF